jgi:transketolase
MTDLVYAPASELARIRSLDIPAEERAAVFANVGRLNALYMIARAGSGHIGTTFSCLDIVSWLFLEELRTNDGIEDVYFSSKGHDVPAMYAVMIGMERLPFEQIYTLRQLDGLPGHPDVGTPGIWANTGSLGMGISKAKGMVVANRLQGTQGNVYVLTGDGELQEGQFWESLQSAANRGLHEITVIVDHNKVQSDTLVERVSDLGDLETKLRAFGWAVGRCDGHDHAAFKQTLERVRQETDKPKIIVADTVKGKGVSFVEHTAMAPTDRLYKFHSGAPDAATYARMTTELLATVNRQLAAADQPELDVARDPFPERTAPTGAQRLVGAYSSALVEEAAKNPVIVALDADLVLDTGLLPFEERFPDRFVECGIAEQDMVSQASGLALRGLLPVVHSFACFLSARPNEQIYNQTTERTKVVYVGSLAGILPGGPGHSHQSVRDISALAAMPGMVLIEPVVRGRDEAGDRVRARRRRGQRLPATGLDPLPDPRTSCRPTIVRAGQGAVS